MNSVPLSSHVSFADLPQQKTNGFLAMPAGKMIREKVRARVGVMPREGTLRVGTFVDPYID